MSRQENSMNTPVQGFRSVWFGHGKTYNAHCWSGVEITSDSLRSIKAAAKALKWPRADIEREDGWPEWVSRDGRHASSTYLWLPRKPNINRQGVNCTYHQSTPTTPT
jgi:hypothetical protein